MSIKIGDDELSVDNYTRLDFDELTQGYLVTRYKPGHKPPRFMSTGTQTVPEKPIKPRRGRPPNPDAKKRKIQGNSMKQASRAKQGMNLKAPPSDFRTNEVVG